MSNLNRLTPVLSRLPEFRLSRRAVVKIAILAGIVSPRARASAAGRAGASLAPARAQTTGEEQIFYHAGLQQDPATFDVNLHPESGAEVETFAGLLTFDANLNAVGDWAVSWDVNEDASLYTFYIRQYNKGWSDGTPVTAHDFVWSWQRQLNPDNGVQHAERLYDIKYARHIHTRAKVDDEQDPLNGQVPSVEQLGVVALDDWTLQVTLAGPRAYFPQVLACRETVPAPRWQVEKYGDKWALGGDVPIVSNGPLKVDQWEHDTAIHMSRNKGYWSANWMKLAKVIDPILPADRAIAAYEKGADGTRLDWTELTPEAFSQFSADPTLAKQIQPSLEPGIWMLVPQVTIAPFDQLEVRQALSHAIDRRRLVTVTTGQTMAASCMVPPNMYGYLDEPELRDIQNFDPQKALALLKGTPYDGGKEWPDLALVYPAGDEASPAGVLAKEIAAQLTEHLHLNVTLQSVTEPDFSEQLLKNAWPLVLSPWMYDYPDPNNGYGDLFYSRREGGRRQAWSNPDFDDLIEQAWAEPDQRKRLDLYLAAERLLQTDAGYLPLVYPLRQLVFKPWVRGVPVNRAGLLAPDNRFMQRMLTQVYVEGRQE
ncbi:MAG TPA: peptide ABC transporter substrate-binding protein [Thermomicrobiales bacterium]|nr:peptide ABC transporter substrate-binding protein [Thermomicrobiales bacterium]